MYRSGSLGRKGLPFVRLPCFFFIFDPTRNKRPVHGCLQMSKQLGFQEKQRTLKTIALHHKAQLATFQEYIILLFPYIFHLSQQISIGFNRVSVGQPLRFRWSFAARGVRIMIDIPSAGRMESLHQI